MSAHARLSPSSAHRWLSCPASIRICAPIPKTRAPAPAAQIGTILHAVFERWLLGDEHEFSDEDVWALEDLDCSLKWARQTVIMALASTKAVFDQYHIPDFLTETKVDAGKLIDRTDIWGTADLVGANQYNKTLFVGDLKTGRIKVPPDNNPQMMIYAAGALAKINFVPKTIALCIIQPPANGKNPATWQCSYADLQAFIEYLGEQADKTDDVLLSPTPSDAACRWCAAKPICPAKN